MAKDAKVKATEGKAIKKAEAVTATTKTEAVKAVEPKQEEKKAEVKAAPKKEEASKEAAPKKSVGRPKKSAKEKVPMVPEIFVQYDDDPAGPQEANLGDIIAKVKAIYVAEGHRESSIKSLKVYVKPQEWKAYYVLNGKIQGELPLF